MGNKTNQLGSQSAILAAAIVLVAGLVSPAGGQVKMETIAGFVPEKTILVLEDDFAHLIKYILEKNEDTLSTETEKATLRQISEAARIQARTNILLLRQNNEVIRLLKKIAKER
jgi:hypothetical protein